jgi:hypothetical protein
MRFLLVALFAISLAILPACKGKKQTPQTQQAMPAETTMTAPETTMTAPESTMAAPESTPTPAETTGAGETGGGGE